MSTTAAAMSSVVLVSLVSLVGLTTISMDEERIRRLSTIFISFAVGALLGDAFIHLLPEIFAHNAAPLRGSVAALAGMLLFFVVEKLLRHRHGALHAHHHGAEIVSRPELAGINILGDAIHNFIDGVLIGSSYLASPALGVTTTLAVLLHEVPQELGDFAILVHSGLSVRRAVLLNLASASVAILGTASVLIVGAVGGTQITSALLPITAGGFVYIAAADLIPELQHDRSLHALVVQTSLIALGIGVMAALAWVG